MKNKIRLALDGIFAFILFFVVFYALTKGQNEKIICIISSIDLSIIFLSIYLGASEKSIKNSRDKENMKNFFIFTRVNVVDYFFTALSSRYTVTKQDCFLTVENTNVFFFLSHSPLSQANVIDSFKNRTREKIAIFCFSFDKRAYRLAQSLPCSITIFNEDKIYELLSLLSYLPTKKIEVKKKYPLTLVVKDFLDAKLSKRLLFSSFILALFSFITPFKNYYAILSFALLILCFSPYIINLFFRQKENTLR